MTFDESRLEILRKVQDGTLTAEEGSDLIRILDDARMVKHEEPLVEPMDEVKPLPVPQEIQQISRWWKAGWSIILLSGALLTGFSAFWAYQGYLKSGMSWGFWLSWIPFIIGLAIMVFGWVLLDSPWLQLRILTNENGKKQKLFLVIPMPLKLFSWFYRTFNRYMSQEMRDKHVDELLEAMERSLKRGEPFQIDVDDKEDGDQVFISISR